MNCDSGGLKSGIKSWKLSQNGKILVSLSVRSVWCTVNITKFAMAKVADIFERIFG
jgi:hypothetical protein